jgi:hypothetical protein
MLSRILRVTELRVTGIRLDPLAQRFIDEAAAIGEINIIANERDEAEYRDKEALVVMPTLAMFKRRVGPRLTPAAVVAEAAQTVLCTYMSASLLIGLVVTAAFGWWWADPAAGLAIAGLAVREAARRVRVHLGGGLRTRGADQHAAVRASASRCASSALRVANVRHSAGV